MTVYANANGLLLPYFEQSNLAVNYNANLPWWMQSPAVAAIVVPVFGCPSDAGPDVLTAAQLAPVNAAIGATTGTSFGVTDYVYCMGATDALCPQGGQIPDIQRGMFHANYATRVADVLDGTSHSFAVGEGAGGLYWPLCRGAGCSAAFNGPSGPQPASNPWEFGSVGNAVLESLGFLTSGIWGTTVDRLNKNPVTDTWIDLSNINNCTCSLNGGTDSAANFRSYHPTGANFLFVDGSGHFVTDSIDLLVYRRLATIREGTTAELP